VTEEQARAAANRTVSASLEIVRGPFSGACFQVERAVCSIGRGDENDVRIRDDTVSLSHATLLLKRGAWFVADLRSMNGTFVDGSRVSGERELHPGARVRLGAVELVFRAIASAPTTPAEPSRPSLWTRFKALMRGIAPTVVRITPPERDCRHPLRAQFRRMHLSPSKRASWRAIAFAVLTPCALADLQAQQQPPSPATASVTNVVDSRPTPRPIRSASTTARRV
jgi:predicted component of type VI protein secretion system